MSDPVGQVPPQDKQPGTPSPAAVPAQIETDNVEASQGLQKAVRDALLLLEYAEQSGFRREDGTSVLAETMNAIKGVATKLKIFDSSEADGDPGIRANCRISTSEWVAFEVAYRQVSELLQPITAKTLRDTEAVGKWRPNNMSPAQSFARWLWVVAIVYAAVVVGGEWGMSHYGPVMEGEAGPENSWMQLVQILIPYAYGGLGSCVYLLRSAHQYIYERTFDIRRKPEYMNRVLLGTISGGAIILFAEHVSADDDGVINLSSAALGFLAGYSTDFLFSTIERIISAILPKVGLDTVRKSGQPPRTSLAFKVEGVGLNDLLERLSAAKTDEEKALFRSLIEKVRDRL